MDSSPAAAVMKPVPRASAQRTRILSALEYPSMQELRSRAANAALIFGMLLLGLLVPALAASSRPGGRDLEGIAVGLLGGALCYWLLYRYNERYPDLYLSARHNLESGGILMLTLDRQLPPLEGGLLGLSSGREQRMIQRENLSTRLDGLAACYPALCDELRLQGRSPATEKQRLWILLICTALVFVDLPFYLLGSDYPLGALGLIALGLLNLLLLRLPLLALRRIERGAFRHALHDCIHGQDSSARAWEEAGGTARIET